MSNNINIGVMSGGAVQQGTSQSTQETKTEFRIDVQAARDALCSVERSIARKHRAGRLITMRIPTCVGWVEDYFGG